MRCHLTAKTNRMCDFANKTKLWGAKSSFSNFRI